MYSFQFNKHQLFWPVIFSVIVYSSFYFPLLNPNLSFNGSDAKNKHIPARVYFYETVVNEHRFPFWTEKQFSGFPIYADPENGYLHPINILSILIFGPISSYKVIHFSFYLIGSISLFILLKRHSFGFITFCVSTLVYFFSFFMLSHNIHFNIITVVFLFPLNILLADLFLERKKLKYILYQALVLSSGVLFGQIQICFLVCLGIFVYLAIIGYKKIKLKQFIIYNLLLGLMIIVITLPQTIPTYELYKESGRSESFSYTKGNLTPPLLSLAAYHYLFGQSDENFSDSVNGDLSYTETTIYLSISAVILALLCLLFMRMTRFKICLYSYIFLFVILACIAYLPIRSSNPIIISMFRYWIRSVFLASFSIGILAGYFIERFLTEFKFKNISKNILYPLAIFVYLLISYKLNINNFKADFDSPPFNWNYLLNAGDTIVWGLVILSTFGLIALYFLNKFIWRNIPKYIFPVLFIALIFLDLRYFARDVLQFRIGDISNEKISSFDNHEKQRIITNNEDIYGMQFLYYKSWSPFGYSQFGNANYLEYLEDHDVSIENYGGSHQSPEYLESLGVNILNHSKENFDDIYMVKPVDLIMNPMEGKYINKEEGYVKMEVNNPTDQEIQTFIMSDKNWVLKVDGNKESYLANDLFLKFNLDKGDHLVEFKYVPKMFYKFLFISLGLIIFVGIIYSTNKRKIEDFLLKY